MVCAVLACAIIGWFGFAIAGWSGLVWSACAVLTFVALAARFDLDDPFAPGGEMEELQQRGRGGRYPQYDQLATQVRWALGDGRYFARVLAPNLRDLAHAIAAHRRGRAVADEQLALALGPAVWSLLTVDPESRDRDDLPSAAEIAMILSAVEGL
jgi:hypothetical protein